jgi:hypothetical protein
MEISDNSKEARSESLCELAFKLGNAIRDRRDEKTLNSTQFRIDRLLTPKKLEELANASSEEFTALTEIPPSTMGREVLYTVLRGRNGVPARAEAEEVIEYQLNNASRPEDIGPPHAIFEPFRAEFEKAREAYQKEAESNRREEAEYMVFRARLLGGTEQLVREVDELYERMVQVEDSANDIARIIHKAAIAVALGTENWLNDRNRSREQK